MNKKSFAYSCRRPAKHEEGVVIPQYFDLPGSPERSDSITSVSAIEVLFIKSKHKHYFIF